VGASAARAALLLFLNPDVRPPAAEDPFAALIAAADDQPAYAGFCPLLLDDDEGAMAGQQRFQFRRLWTPSAIVRDALLVNQLRPANRALVRDRYLDADRSKPFEVQQPAAAALGLRRSVFEAVGGFDARYLPAWWEDADLAERLARAGHRLVTVPAARFVHDGGSSLRGARRVTPYEFGRIYTRNQLQHARRWWGPRVALGLRLAIVAGSVARLGLLGIGVRGERTRRDAAAIATGSLVSACAPVGRPVFPKAG
jgi:GT2 family glycosyltransferase